jgi:hypothetical protein
MFNITTKVKFFLIFALLLTIFVTYNFKIKILTDTLERENDLAFYKTVSAITALPVPKLEKLSSAVDEDKICNVFGLKKELDLNIDEDVEKYYTLSFKIHKTLREQLKAINKNPKNYDFSF